MINHVRTLLMNLDGPAPVFDPGEEYVPPGYKAVEFSYPLVKARTALFGSNPDRRAVIYRTRQLLACIHASPLAEHATLDDPRITYLPLTRGGFEMPCGTAITAKSGAVTLNLQGVGPVGRDDRTSFSWLINVNSSVNISVTAGDGGVASQTLNFAGNVSDPVPLQGGGTLAAIVPAGAGTAAWSIRHLTEPAFELATAAERLANAGADTMIDLFGTAPIGPQLTWLNLWESRRPLPDRLAAAALALAYRTGQIAKRGT